MLENMDDLFSIENQESCCYCCPCFYYESATSVTTNSLEIDRSHTFERLHGNQNYYRNLIPLSVMGTKIIPSENLLQNILLRNYKNSKSSRNANANTNNSNYNNHTSSNSSTTPVSIASSYSEYSGVSTTPPVPTGVVLVLNYNNRYY